MSNNFGEIVFGAGTAILTPAAANGPTNPTPLQLPIMQELSIDFSGDLAELYGQDQYPYALARTKVKIECKAKMGAIYAALLSDLFFGATLATGQAIPVLREVGTVTTHAYTTVHAANFATDGGVVNQTIGQPYRLVPSAPAVGQYTQASGVYTFNASDTITVALVTYTYTSASTGQSTTVTNKPMGAMPTFNFQYMNNQFGSNLYLEFYNATAKKIGLPGKNTEFDMFDFEFSCYSQIGGNVFYLALDE